MEDFANFNIAKKLKEKGFREGCFGYYGYCEDVFYYNVIQDPIPSRQLTFKDFKDLEERQNVYSENCRYDAPTISQVLKWLREEKDIDLVISPVFFYDDVLGKMREYACKVYTPSLEHCGYHEKWEQAALAGIEYVLDNLI